MNRIKKYQVLLEAGKTEEAKKVLSRLLRQHAAFTTDFVTGFHLSYKDIEFKELYHCAQIGLCLAAKKFEFKKEVGFLTYARYWMRDEIQKCIRSHRARLHHHKSVRLNREQMQKLKQNPYITAEELGVDHATLFACLTFLEPWRFEAAMTEREAPATDSKVTEDEAYALEISRKAKEFFTHDELRFLQQFVPLKGTEIEKKVARFLEWIGENDS